MKSKTSWATQVGYTKLINILFQLLLTRNIMVGQMVTIITANGNSDGGNGC